MSIKKCMKYTYNRNYVGMVFLNWNTIHHFLENNNNKYYDEF